MAEDRKFVQVNLRLLATDVEAAKKEAEQEGTSWHVILRQAVHQGMKRRRRVVR